MARWHNRGLSASQKLAITEQERLDANNRRMELAEQVAHMYAKEYSRNASMGNLAALVAREEQRSFGSGRVIARDRLRAITTTEVEVIKRDPILCWACQNPLKESEIDSDGRRVACQKCTREHESVEVERAAAIQARREAAVEARQAEREAWRLAQYEKRLAEQEELDARKGERYETGARKMQCTDIQGPFGMDYLCNPVLQEFFELGDHGLVPRNGDLIIEAGYKKERVSGSGWVYWLLIDDSIVVIEVWEENLFPAVIEKVEVHQ